MSRIKWSPKSMSCRIDSRNRPHFNRTFDNKQITVLPLFGCFSKKKTFNDFFGLAERALFAQGHIKMFSPSVTSICVSSLEIYFSRHLLVGLILFLYKHYDGFTIFQIPSFWPKKIFFREYLRKI